MKEISKTIGKRVKQAREDKGLTQKELGDQLGYSAMGISYFEQGEREMKISDIQKLADFFGKNISYFLSPSLTMFRADKVDSDDDGTTQSLASFDDFLAKRREE